MACNKTQMCQQRRRGSVCTAQCQLITSPLLLTRGPSSARGPRQNLCTTALFSLAALLLLQASMQAPRCCSPAGFVASAGVACWLVRGEETRGKKRSRTESRAWTGPVPELGEGSIDPQPDQSCDHSQSQLQLQSGWLQS